MGLQRWASNLGVVDGRGAVPHGVAAATAALLADNNPPFGFRFRRGLGLDSSGDRARSWRVLRRDFPIQGVTTVDVREHVAGGEGGYDAQAKGGRVLVMDIIEEHKQALGGALSHQRHEPRLQYNACNTDTRENDLEVDVKHHVRGPSLSPDSCSNRVA